MDANALTGYIRQGIRKEISSDRIQLYLPFVFGGKQTEICLTWDKKGVLSDGGRTMDELKKRVGDLTPYRESIQNILNVHGMVTLEGGHKLAVRYAQTRTCGDQTWPDHMYGLNRLLRVMSLISIVDTVAVADDGTVSLC